MLWISFCLLLLLNISQIHGWHLNKNSDWVCLLNTLLNVPGSQLNNSLGYNQCFFSPLKRQLLCSYAASMVGSSRRLNWQIWSEEGFLSFLLLLLQLLDVNLNWNYLETARKRATTTHLSHANVLNLVKEWKGSGCSSGGQWLLVIRLHKESKKLCVCNMFRDFISLIIWTDDNR